MLLSIFSSSFSRVVVFSESDVWVLSSVIWGWLVNLPFHLLFVFFGKLWKRDFSRHNRNTVQHESSLSFRRFLGVFVRQRDPWHQDPSQGLTWLVYGSVDCVIREYGKVYKGGKAVQFCSGNQKVKPCVLLQTLHVLTDQCWHLPPDVVRVEVELALVSTCQFGLSWVLDGSFGVKNHPLKVLDELIIQYLIQVPSNSC